MYLKIPEFEIADSANPFAEDKLGRSESAEILTELLKSLEGPFVLSINGLWGSGKTTFVKMWLQSLKNEGFHYLYFNAWQHDFYPDPLIPLISEAKSSIVSTLAADKSRAKQAFDKIVRASGKILKRAVPVAVKAATAGVVNVDDFADEVISTFAGEMIEGKTTLYEAVERAIAEFRQTLTDFASALAEDSPGPVVFVIDELDRCRPTYAVELLERVKHLFSVRGIVFVLVMDKDQIGHSIRALYGVGMDIDGYLRRFIDLDYELPQPSSEAFCHYLYTRFGLDEYFTTRRKVPELAYEKDALLETFVMLSRMFTFGLRVQEQCFTQFTVVFRTVRERQYCQPDLLAFLIALKAHNRPLYYRFIRYEMDVAQVSDFLRALPNADRLFGHREGDRLEAAILTAYCRNDDELEALVDQYRSHADDQARPEPERERSAHQVSLMQNRAFTGLAGSIARLAKRIEVAERFV